MVGIEWIPPSGEQIFAAIRGMRNPLNSWDRMDSHVDFDPEAHTNRFTLESNDRKLAQRLISSGTEHRKFLRQIPVMAVIKAPLYWWKQMDKYQVGTCTNSCSTMHKLMSRQLTVDDFSLGGLEGARMGDGTYYKDYFEKDVLPKLNGLIWVKEQFGTDDEYDTKARKTAFDSLVAMLPESYNQTRTWSGNYEVLRTIARQRKNHKLKEWRDFISAMEALPCAKEFLF